MSHIPESHTGHDPLRIAALAAGDLAGAERPDVERLVAECPACAELAADLRSIAAATAAVPPPARRRRDFRISAEDAARLRPRGWRAIPATLAAPRFSFTRPLAVGLTTLGIAGLLLTALPAPLLQGGATGDGAAGTAAAGRAPSGAPPDSNTQAAPNPVSATEGPAVLAIPSPEAAAPGGETGAAPPGSPTERLDASAGSDDGARARAATPAPGGPVVPPLVALSVAFLVVGLAILLLHASARRMGYR